METHSGTSSAFYAPIHNILQSDYCYSHVAVLQLNTSPLLGAINFKAKTDHGYPATFQASSSLRKSFSPTQTLYTKLATNSLLSVSAYVFPVVETSAAALEVESQMMLNDQKSWGKHRVAGTYPFNEGKVTLGLSNGPSVVCSVTTSDPRYGIAVDLELNLSKRKLTEYHTACFWSVRNWYFCLLHQSTDSSKVSCGNLYFAHTWRISDTLKVADELVYKGKTNRFVTTVGFAFKKPLHTLKAKIDSEGYFSTSFERALSPSATVLVSSHFDAKNLQGLSESFFGFRLKLTPS